MYTEELYQPEDTAFSGNLEVVHILPRFINDQNTIEGQVSWIHFLDSSFLFTLRPSKTTCRQLRFGQ